MEGVIFVQSPSSYLICFSDFKDSIDAVLMVLQSDQ